jgi:hypothetical protein
MLCFASDGDVVQIRWRMGCLKYVRICLLIGSYLIMVFIFGSS